MKHPATQILAEFVRTADGATLTALCKNRAWKALVAGAVGTEVHKAVYAFAAEYKDNEYLQIHFPSPLVNALRMQCQLFERGLTIGESGDIEEKT
jgi:hypothetical protein